jgi:bifunctional DNA-binding transcriptional regulator/antitoxin component of YhaV-PrlF toxin-antitoxin module
MTIEYAKVTSKGQITVPELIRKLLHLSKDSFVAFKITPQGIILVPAKMVEEKTPYTKKEWQKIEKLAAKKGKIYKSSESAKKHLKSL